MSLDRGLKLGLSAPIIHEGPKSNLPKNYFDFLISFLFIIFNSGIHKNETALKTYK